MAFRIGLLLLSEAPDADLREQLRLFQAALDTLGAALNPPAEPPTDSGDVEAPPHGYENIPAPLWAAISDNFPAGVRADAVRVSYAESGFRADATNDTRDRGNGDCGVPYELPDGRPAVTEYSVGPWQINLCVHTAIREGEARDYGLSTAYAAGLWRASGWAPWLYTAQRLGLL